MGDQIVLATQSFFRSGWLLKEFNKTFISSTLRKKGEFTANFGLSVCVMKAIRWYLRSWWVDWGLSYQDRWIQPKRHLFQITRLLKMWCLLKKCCIVFLFKINKGFLGIKLDFQKAYNQIKWKFLLLVLIVVGFNDKFINLINPCISMVQFPVILNEGQCPSVSPSHGIRLGDPISPYLFILGSEVLMRLINRENITRLDLCG